jgi:hypothetical protein
MTDWRRKRPKQRNRTKENKGSKINFFRSTYREIDKSRNGITVTKLLDFCAAPLKIEASVTRNQQASKNKEIKFGVKF